MTSAFFTAIIPLAVIAITQLFKQFRDRDYQGVVTVLVAAVIGIIGGIQHYMGLDIQTSLTLALGAVGLHTITKNIG